ncbi:MAG: transcriptional regulator [endosymbiont of Galathealinum brachiosum]|uniref:Transcriptional regulator n=1 Tax=endosymbiont of Galathealinum brachiosum TaxID=2200906 RepID=A0A370DJJ8_9GAMM|nr:MAG: transcriptional regulator [endosymbiont of Galathealinum brachiosum]
MRTHKELKQQMLDNPDVKSEYDSLEEEFSLFDELLNARMNAGLTQAEVAHRMGTKTPAIARLEAGGGNKKHSPSISTLRKYAEAVNCHIEIRLVRN